MNFESNKYHVAITKPLGEVVKPIEARFKFHCEIEGFKFFRKTQVKLHCDGTFGVVVGSLGFEPITTVHGVML